MLRSPVLGTPDAAVIVLRFSCWGVRLIVPNSFRAEGLGQFL